jgi:hypothetical protein
MPMLAHMTDATTHPPLLPAIAMTVTFVSEAKKFAFAARHDTGESVYVSPMLAEQAGLDRRSAGRVLVATIAANVDDVGATTSTPWRAMSWERCEGIARGDAAPHLVDGEVATLRNELNDALVTIDKLRACIAQAIAKLD